MQEKSLDVDQDCFINLNLNLKNDFYDPEDRELNQATRNTDGAL